jgi:phage antirepressor YoqD-like protein
MSNTIVKKEVSKIASPEVRNQLSNRVEVLDRVKQLLLLGQEQFGTMPLIAEFYEADIKTIEKVVQRHMSEFQEDGVRILRGSELSAFKSESGYRSHAGQLTVFPKRSILRIGMLLRKSPIAQEVRNQLLNVEEAATKEMKLDRIQREQLITVNMGKAIANGDIQALAKFSAELSALKNEHIAENKPKVDGYNAFLSKADNMTFRQAAQLLRLPERKLIRYLEENRYLYRSENTILPYANYRLDGYFAVRKAGHGYWHQTLITPTGLEYLRQRVAPAIRAQLIEQTA